GQDRDQSRKCSLLLMAKLGNRVVDDEQRHPMLAHIVVTRLSSVVLKISAVTKIRIAASKHVAGGPAKAGSACHSGKEDKELTEQQNHVPRPTVVDDSFDASAN